MKDKIVETIQAEFTNRYGTGKRKEVVTSMKDYKSLPITTASNDNEVGFVLQDVVLVSKLKELPNGEVVPVYELFGENGDKILDKGNKFIVKKLDSPDTVRDLLKISKKRFGNGNIRVNGDRNFQRRVMYHALKMNIDIKLSDPVLQREYDLKWSRLKFEEKNRALIAQEKIKYNSLLELQLEQKRKEHERQNRGNQQHTKSERDQSEKTRNSGRSI